MDRRKTLTLLGGALASSCSLGPRRIHVGAKNFTEQLILGEALAQQIERRLSVPADRRLNLGGTLLAHQSLINGAIDLYPEYTGTALTAVLRLPPEHDPRKVFDRVAKEYKEKFNVEWLPPFGFNNSFVMVVRGSDAKAGGLKTISDAAKQRGGWTLGIGYEFERRPDGLAALNRAYGLNWKAAPITMDLGLLYKALEQGQVTMVAGNGTDGILARRDFTVLEDDMGVFPPYQPAIAVRTATLSEFPALRDALVELSGAISEELMRELNLKLDGEHRPVREVAGELLSRLKK